MSENASNRWERLERLYHAARERPLAERAAFLSDACGDDATLRRDLESLLSQADDDGVLEPPAPKHPDSLTNTSAENRFPGGTLRVYEIQGHIGAGGMGEVYRARDTTLGRDVAIKVLPGSVSDDPGRRARFEREARLLAALNHPHIAQIYGFEEFDGGHALVMELVEGHTLKEIIGDRTIEGWAGAVPITKALGIARQIADALDAAHEKGIVHRDLKPSNIKVTSAGIVKVLDFGLAKGVDPTVAVAVAAITTEVTRQPVILGTVPYMSPEQARGEPVDKRSDIWAFGCVLFEMLVGRAPFEGHTTSDTLFRILGREPDWDSLPAETPTSVRTLLERCLRKDPSHRLHDIADARIELDDVERSAGTAKVTTRPATTRREQFAWTISILLVVCLLSLTVVLYRRGIPSTVGLLEFPISLPTQDALKPLSQPDFAISPDGQQIAAVLFSDGTLWVRAVTGPPWRALTGTQGATAPFWKPDSQSIGFFTEAAGDRKLKTVNVTGGQVNIVCDIPDNRPMYGAWSNRHVIVFSGDVVLRQVAENGGNSTRATQRDQTQVGRNEIDRSPSFLPDGDHFLFLAQSDAGENGQAQGGSRAPTSLLRVGSISSAETTSLGQFESNAIYGSGYLLFAREDGRLIAQPFDANSHRLTGDPQTVAENVAVLGRYRRAQLSVSVTGRLAYSQTVEVTSQLTWFDRDGRSVRTAGEPGIYSNMNLSSDDSRLLVTRVTNPTKQRPTADIWLINFAHGDSGTPLTSGVGAADPAWSQDESRIVFNSFDPAAIHDVAFSLFQRSASGTGTYESLTNGPTELSGPEWSPDGRVLMYSRRSTRTAPRELWTIAASGDRRPRPFLNTSVDEASGTFSPKGDWIAYEAKYSERYEIYVCSFPGADNRIQISTNGGRAPRWRRDGSELYFLAPDGTMMAAAVTHTAKSLQAAVPRSLFQTTLKGTPNLHPYVVTKDGQRFLWPVSNRPAPSSVTVILDWPAKLGK